MKRIINHWTGGSYNVSALDKKHYHVIIDGDGQWHKGNHTIEANENTKDGDYAAHTLGCNTGSIGIAVAAMGGAKQGKTNGAYPLKREQWDAMVEQNAHFALKYGIPITPQTILTHAEVEKTLGIKQKGKWDITVLPFDEDMGDENPKGAEAVGDRLRSEVAVALRELKKKKANKEAMTVKTKPVLKHRRVQTLLGSAAGSTGIIGVMTGWEWQAIVAILVFFALIFAYAMWAWGDQIKAGLFGPEEE
jgi:hypothetical protein